MKSVYFAASIVLAFTGSALSQPLESYTARLSAKDHFNSSGVRLESAAAIIRQDRANYYVYGSHDSEDEPDGFFKSKDNRARLETMLNHGTFSDGARKAILNGTPLITVDIYPDFINVTVERD
ncbi:hypothetical protein ACTJJ7_15755 [Phyllobacterium sp. 22229]|uniref:hypothetical protein n=1 Tax=Phyllobacterium sp. 22229 TaxID=3453895 RepID=UPI003F826A75